MKDLGWDKIKIHEAKSCNRTYLLILNARDVDENIYHKLKETLQIKINVQIHQDIIEELSLLDKKYQQHFKTGLHKILPRNKEVLEFIGKRILIN